MEPFPLRLIFKKAFPLDPAIGHVINIQNLYNTCMASVSSCPVCSCIEGPRDRRVPEEFMILSDFII